MYKISFNMSSLAWITRLSLLQKPSAALHRVSWGILAHNVMRECTSELQLTHEEKHKNLPLKGTEHNSPLPLVWWWGWPNLLAPEMQKVILALSTFQKEKRLPCFGYGSSTVNNFSSEKMISSVSVHAFNLLRRIFVRSSLFSFWRSVRRWQVCILRDDNFKSVLTVFLIILSLTFISQAISIMNLFGLHQTWALTASTTFGVFQKIAIFHNRGQSSVSSSMWKTVVAVFSTFEFSKPCNSVVNSQSCSFKKLHYFRVCLACPMELNNGCTLSTHIWY